MKIFWAVEPFEFSVLKLLSHLRWGSAPIGCQSVAICMSWRRTQNMYAGPQKAKPVQTSSTTRRGYQTTERMCEVEANS
eukprot:3637843-Amphidinium_carterae.1